MADGARTPKSLAAVFARELRAARRARGLTQAEAAEKVGIAIEVYGRLERGRSLPRAETLVRIVTELGASADALLGIRPAALDAAAHEAEAEYEKRPEVRRLLRMLERASPRVVRLLVELLAACQS